MREHCVISCTLPSVPRSPSPDLVAGYHFNTPPTGLHSPASTRAWPASRHPGSSLLRSYTFCYTFLYVPGGLLILLFMCTWASCGDPDTRLHVGSVSAPVCLCPHLAIPLTFLYVLLYVPIRSGRPPHISVYGHLGLMWRPWDASARRIRFCPCPHLAISLTFLYVLLYVPIRSVRPSHDSGTLSYVPIRSVYVPYAFRLVFDKALLGSYTFLYVPCDPLMILEHCHTFLYVPYTFRIRSALFLLKVVQKLYVPIRSAQRLSHFF